MIIMSFNTQHCLNYLVDKPLLSFPSDKPTIKIDYIFTSHDLCVKRADIPEIISADHRPHIAEIN